MHINDVSPSICSESYNYLHCIGGWTDKLPDWLVAIGTLGAVVVALWQNRAQRAETTSRIYYEQAVNVLRRAVEDFEGTTLANGRPLNGRRHWLNFARGIGTAQELATKIKTTELREIWKRTEHGWREHVYDLLDPMLESYPADYYGYSAPSERIKNFAQSPRERTPLSEPSLVLVYRWIVWPEGYVDALDKKMKFSDAEIEKMELFGPRGLAEYIRILREGGAGIPKTQPSLPNSPLPGQT